MIFQRTQGEQGTTGVRFLIGETGDVIECNVENSSGYARLDDAACSFVRRWKYKPATEGGKATTQIATANIEFRSGLGSVTDLLNFPNVSKGATLPPEPSGPSDPAMDVPNSYVPPPRGNR
jgi:TonB family protein